MHRVACALFVSLTAASAGADQPGPLAEPPGSASAAALAPATSQEIERLLAEIDGLAGLPVPEAPADGAELEPPAPAPAATVEEAGRRFEESGFAPVVALPTHRLHPFGHEVPTLRCLPTRACDLVLEPGEAIDGHALGDPESWQTAVLLEGQPPALTPHFVVKPSAFGLATNLVLVTDRRAYHLELVSPAESEARADGAAYDHRVGWWYPERWIERRRAEEELARARREARAEATPAALPLDPTALDWGYRVEHPRRRSRRLGWEPAAVVDDGRRTWVRLPERALAGELPAAFGVLADGSYAPLNARYRDGWLLIPAVVDALDLVLGAGDGRRSLRIVRSR